MRMKGGIFYYARNGKSTNLVDEVRIEDVKLVALHNLWRGIVDVVVGLVVLVPLEAGVNAVEVARLPRSENKVTQFWQKSRPTRRETARLLTVKKIK